MGACRFIVRGRVQGVGYRYFVRRAAASLGITGYAKNLADGSVEVVAEGPDDRLADLEGRLREGPDFAQVSGLDREAIAPRGDDGFHIR